MLECVRGKEKSKGKTERRRLYEWGEDRQGDGGGRDERDHVWGKNVMEEGKRREGKRPNMCNVRWASRRVRKMKHGRSRVEEMKGM